ncbi:MAG: alpha/beta fold hydrolase [Gemmatimonadaceae bacterium]
MSTTAAQQAHREPSAGNESAAAPAWVDKTAFPFRSRFLAVMPGSRVHYIDEGAGDVMLFVHGTPSWSFEWRHVIAAMSQKHRCIAMDLLGFGLSDRPRGFDYTPESHARVLRAFVDRLDLRDITLVVHDFGGPIAMPIALDKPQRVRRLAIVNTWMWSFEDEPAMRRKAGLINGRLGRFLYRHANFSLRVLMPSAYADRRKLSRQIHAQYLAPFPDSESRGQVLFSLARALLGSSAYYESLWRQRELLRSRPALIIWGMKDPAFPPAMLERWRTVLPTAHVVRLAVGHWPQEEAPDDFTRALEEFTDAGPA